MALKTRKMSMLDRMQSMVVRPTLFVDQIPSSSDNTTPNKGDHSDKTPTPTSITPKNLGDASHHRKRTSSGRSLLVVKPFNQLSATNLSGAVTPENKSNRSSGQGCM